MIIPTIILAAVMTLSCDKYDDTALSERVSSLESRVTALEKKANDNADAIQKLSDAVKNKISVTSFKELSDKSGYELTLSSGEVLTIKNGTDGTDGKDGTDGQTPSVSATLDSDGNYYWTVNGEYLVVDGKKVKAESITPVFKIEKNYWYVSYDGEKTWTKLGKAMEETVVISSVTVSDRTVTISLGNGTTFTLPLSDGSLVSTVTSISYVPAFWDGKARVYSSGEEKTAELKFEVLPSGILDKISAANGIAYSVKAVYTADPTRASAGEIIELPVLGSSCRGDYLTVKVDCSSLASEFGSVLGASVSLHISDGTKDIASEYVALADGGERTRSRTFNSDNIVASFGVISDVHINTGVSSTSTKFASALAQLKSKSAMEGGNGLDGVLVVGDLIDNPNTSYLSAFKSTYEAACDPEKVPMVYTVGNHDVPNYRWSASMVSDAAYLRTGLGSAYFETDKDPEAGTSMECRHCVIGGYNILAISPNGTQPIVYDQAAVNWLDSKLNEITTAEPEKYVIVLTHPMIYNTVYGSLLGESSGEWISSSTGYWATHALTSVLDKYPQAVVFGGHLHFPLNDPRSIWQGNFTVSGCASVRYMALEAGGYENMASATTMKDKDEFSQGNLLQFDGDGNMRICRMDFYNQGVIGDPLTMSYPDATGSHLEKYSHIRRSLQNAAPATPTAEITVTGGNIVADFHATDDEFVHDYTLTLTKDGSLVCTKKFLTDFYKHLNASEMAGSQTCTLAAASDGDYVLTIVARDSWEATSTLNRRFTISSGAIDESGEHWTGDAAGSMQYAAGDGTVTSGWLKYVDGVLSWEENATGKPRSQSITLPDGSVCKIQQVSVSDFKGSWTLYSKLFDPNKTVGKGGTVVADNTAITIGDPLKSQTLQDDAGVSHTNNLGIKGLYGTSTLDVAVEIDYSSKSVRFGVFFDRTSPQTCADGKYMVYLPGCNSSNKWTAGAYNFAPSDFSASGYDWLWMTVSPDFNTVRHVYYNSTAKTGSGKYYVCAISCVKASSSDPSSIGTSYDVVYQANYNSNNTVGMYMTRQ